MNRKRNLLILLGVVLSLLVFVAAEARAAAPCCGITGIDYKTGIVRARNTENGETFQFKVSNKATVKMLRVGQEVYADFTTGKVIVEAYGTVPPIAGIILTEATGTKGLGEPPIEAHK